MHRGQQSEYPISRILGGASPLSLNLPRYIAPAGSSGVLLAVSMPTEGKLSHL